MVVVVDADIVRYFVDNCKDYDFDVVDDGIAVQKAAP